MHPRVLLLVDDDLHLTQALTRARPAARIRAKSYCIGTPALVTETEQKRGLTGIFNGSNNFAR